MSRVDWVHRQAARASGNGGEKADFAVPSLPHVSPESDTWSSRSTGNGLHPEGCYRPPGAPDRQSPLLPKIQLSSSVRLFLGIEGHLEDLGNFFLSSDD